MSLWETDVERKKKKSKVKISKRAKMEECKSVGAAFTPKGDPQRHGSEEPNNNVCHFYLKVLYFVQHCECF